MKKTDYFKDCETLDEARKMYYKLAMQLHPDKGGDEEEFKDLANQFDAFRPGKLKYENEVNDWSSKIYANIISQLISIPDIDIEVCGSWIWISGDTLKHRDKIKAIEVDEFYNRGFSKTKHMIYFSPKGYRKRSKEDLSMDTIRELYGSESIESKGDKGRLLQRGGLSTPFLPYINKPLLPQRGLQST